MPKAKSGGKAGTDSLRDKFLERVGELWDKHYAEAEEVMDQSEDKKVCVTFKANIDTSESSPTLAVGFSAHLLEIR